MPAFAKSSLSAAALALVLAAQGAPAAPAPPQARAAQELVIDRGRTAVLVMDYENDIVGMLPEPARAPLLDRAAAVLKSARAAHLPIIYVVVRFPRRLPRDQPRQQALRDGQGAGGGAGGDSGSGSACPGSPPSRGSVVTKRRVGAFSTTDLEVLLRANHITTLAMFGISTSGVVLSTVRWAADMDYQIIVVSDACADFDEEVHRVLTGKVFPGQATVVTTEAMVRALEGVPKP